MTDPVEVVVLLESLETLHAQTQRRKDQLKQHLDATMVTQGAKTIHTDRYHKDREAGASHRAARKAEKLCPADPVSLTVIIPSGRPASP